MNQFVHLHLHSEYSLVDGLVRIKPLAKAIAAAGMPAVAVTDQHNLFAMVKFYRAAIAAGVKPIVGTELQLTADDPKQAPDKLVLLCQSEVGYNNLSRLLSKTYLEGQQQGKVLAERNWLVGASDGLIALSGGRQGDIGRLLLAGKEDAALARARHWMSMFPERFYLELQRTGREDEELYLQACVELARQVQCPVVATNDVRFLKADDFEAHEARVCIQEGRTLADSRRERHYSEQQYLRTPAEMAELFADLPEALANSVEIAKRCNFKLNFDEYFLPKFPIPAGQTIDEHFSQVSRQGLDKRLQKILDPKATDYQERLQEYTARLDEELGVICQMGFPGYFLIVADFIQWAKNNGVPVGPGRGSGAGSVIAYALEITDLDPLEHELLFERFLNPERVSMPDFDIDFCMDGRDRVIDYVAEKYGREKVSQIITYGTMAAKAVVRDVGRVLSFPYGFVDRIAKLIPFEIGMTLDKALDESEDLAEQYRQEDDVRELIDLAKQLEGLARNAGKHAGGVVIAPSALTDFTPLYCEEGGGGLVTQFDKDDVEAIGLVKFDFLGLRTLTIIDHAVKRINKKRQSMADALLDISALAMEDVKTFKLLQSCATTAVFQLESRGMKELIKRLQPDCFNDIVALVALFRPGPLQSGMVDDFIDRKHGAKVEYPHPAIIPILKPTYGVILYQEQVMQIAQVLAGYTLGGADLLRRAMGKKKPEEMAKQREIFVTGAEKNDVDLNVATYIFDLMEKFAGYGFNKSHSAAYALLSYQTAWLKAHYPTAFMASVLSADMDNTDKIVTLIDECESMELDVIPPDVNASGYAFDDLSDTEILYGLGAIKGVGQGAIESILQEREHNGPFADLNEFCRRIDAHKVNRRVMEALVRSGALDSLNKNRAQLLEGLPEVLRAADQYHRDQAAGQDDLFGSMSAKPVTEVLLPAMDMWDEDTRLRHERETLGLYLTGHPINQHLDELKKITHGRINELCQRVEANAFGKRSDQSVRLAGLVLAMRARNTRSGRMAFTTLDDRSGRVECIAGPELFERCGALLTKDTILVVEGDLGIDDFSGGFRLRANAIYDLDQARNHFAKSLELTVNGAATTNGFVNRLQETLSPYKDGSCRLRLHYKRADVSASVDLGEEWKVKPAEHLLTQLAEILGEGSVELKY